MTEQAPRPLDCVACLGGWPVGDHRIGDLGATVAYLNPDQFFPGWTFVVLKRHATELFQLSREERGRLIEEVTAAARALAAIFAPVKLNYELLGNQVAHIHWHVIPRLAGDPAPREPVWRVPHDPRRLTGEEVQALVERIRRHL